MIISETIHAMHIEFAVKIVWLKVYMAIASPMTLTSQGYKSEMCLKLDYFLICNIS